MDEQQQPQQFDALSSHIEEALVYDMAAESQARALDLRLAKVERMPAGYLNQKRASGQIRNPWMPGPFFNVSAQEAIRTSWDPEVQKLAVYLAKQAGVPLPARDYEAEARAEKNRQLDEEMAAWVQEARANRERAFAEHRARMAQGTPKFPGHLSWTGRGGR
jgi:hypothetical protein